MDPSHIEVAAAYLTMGAASLLFLISALYIAEVMLKRINSGKRTRRLVPRFARAESSDDEEGEEISEE
ncbi:MAG: hypothetical protein WD850_03545 [Candidatus Spechtbacterales bacterium]